MATKSLKNWWSVLIEARSDSPAESLALDDERLDFEAFPRPSGG